MLPAWPFNPVPDTCMDSTEKVSRGGARRILQLFFYTIKPPVRAEIPNQDRRSVFYCLHDSVTEFVVFIMFNLSLYSEERQAII